MNTQIDQLNQAVADLQAANAALAARVAAIPAAPDLSGTIAAVQGVTSSLNSLLPAPAPSAPPANG